MATTKTKTKKSTKRRYFKLGSKASVFNDPTSGLNIRGKETVSIASKKILTSNKTFNTAKESGHIIEVKEADIEDMNAVTHLPIVVPEKKGKKKKISELDEDQENDSSVG